MRKLMILLCCVLSLTAFADEDDGVHEGVVNGLDDQYLHVVIDDGVFPFALNAKFSDAKGREVNRFALKPGMQVRYTFSEGANGFNQITAVQIIQQR